MAWAIPNDNALRLLQHVGLGRLEQSQLHAAFNRNLETHALATASLRTIDLIDLVDNNNASLKFIYVVS